VTEEIAISVQDVTKKYRLFASPQERLKEALHPFRKRYHREFWALKGVNFDVPKGQTVGILGRNGSGKSTLLQIIAGVMRPNGGEVIVNGRVSALLDLGAGFNPEFTGRENVRFQARVVGVPREEIDRRLPEIEAFADIGEFFDQPVKTYSSGMFMRVAFAAAINVDPDILIVDEVLSVGDAKFQHKCFLTFKRFLDAGKTVVIVSHDVGTLLRLCDSGIVLEGGEIHFSGVISQATNCYQELLFGKDARRIDDGDSEVVKNEMAASGNTTKSTRADTEKLSGSAAGDTPLYRDGTSDHCSQRPSYNKSETRLGDGRVLILDYAVVADGQLEPATIPFGAELSIYLKIYFVKNVDNVSVGFAIISKEGVYVHGTNLYMQGERLLNGRAGETLILRFVWCPKLVGGDYFLNLGCHQVSEDQDLYLDARRSIAHLQLADTQWCTGFVGAESRLEQIERIPCVVEGLGNIPRVEIV
jgi:lipopolysaccharide transport system ATP-binding protein